MSHKGFVVASLASLPTHHTQQEQEGEKLENRVNNA